MKCDRRANMAARVASLCLAFCLTYRTVVASVLDCSNNQTCSNASKGQALLQAKSKLLRLAVDAGNGHTGVSQACPEDNVAQAENYFTTHFEQECGVVWADVPHDIKSSFQNAFAVSDLHFVEGTKASSCRVIVPLGATELSFQIKPPDDMEESVPNENWGIVEGTTKYIGDPMGRLSMCSIFDFGVPKTVDVPASKILEVTDQLQTYFSSQCDIDGNHLVIAGPPTPNYKAKMSMAEQGGNEEYCIVLNVDYPTSDGAKAIEICFEEQPLDEATAAMIADQLDEANRVEQAEQAYLEQQQEASAPGPRFLQTGQKKAKRIVDIGDTVENIFGPWTLMDEHISPPLCCMCNNCAAVGIDPTSCTEGGGSENWRRSSLVEKQPKPLPALRQNSTPLHGSQEANRPPSRISRSGTPPRRTVMPGFGDTFHASVLPKRTEADHARIWAQSRALVEIANQTGTVVPAEYNYYDDDLRSNCFQLAYNQGKCGSCWAFASLGALEKQICMRAGGRIVPSLSREMLVRCSEQNMGCAGGNANTAYEDLMEIGGVFSTDCIPYQGEGSKHCPGFTYSWNGQGSVGKTGRTVRIDQELQQSCDDFTRFTNRPPMGPEWDMPFTMMYEARFGAVADPNDVRLQRFRRNFAKSRARDRLSSWWLYGEEAMKTAVTKYGSIYASYEARDDFKKRSCKTGCWPPGTVWGEESFEPSTGAFTESNCGCKSGHAVHIIGYGTDIQETGLRIPYWLIENSWGSGEDEPIHGNVLGEDVHGVSGFGKDPFTELHPMGIEDQCIIAGWLASALPRTGGCGGNAEVNIREDIEVQDGPPDGFVFAIDVDGTPLVQVDVAPDSGTQFQQNFSMSPGDHTIELKVYSRNHPKQQALALENYYVKAVSVRCRGRGFRYSFTKNDALASLSWGRKTRQQLRAEIDQLLLANGVYDGQRFENCPETCRTGSYSEVKPCVGLLLPWGTCYTDEWIMNHAYYIERGTNCTQCAPLLIQRHEEALATKNLDEATYLQWYNLITEALTAPDEPGWMRQFHGSCQLESSGHTTNTQLTATYQITMPNGADGSNRGRCNEQHSAPFAQGQFVHAPDEIRNGGRRTVRCPSPLKGEVHLSCSDGVLRVTSHTCGNRGTVNTDATGYFKILRGHDYHGIEESASFAIAEMARFADLCPTTGWTRWSECTSKPSPCVPGTQSRSREPLNGADRTSIECSNLQFHESRSCVSPGFCPQVLTRMVSGGGADVNGFLASYKSQSYTLGQYPTAGSHFLTSVNLPCSDAQFWCSLIAGTSACGMYFEGHFEVKESGEYILRYQVEEGSGEIEFNTFGEGDEMKPELKVKASTTAGGGEMFSWQDYGFHHRRRRTDLKPWERVSSFALNKGIFFARMTRVGWTTCPTFSLQLERTSSKYMPPLLTGQSSFGLTSTEGGQLVKGQVQWDNFFARPESRRRYSYLAATEMGSENEIALRNKDGTQIGTQEISKLNFTASELYALFNITDKSQPANAKYWSDAEMVIRSTVIIPEAGQYKFKYQQDMALNDDNRLWKQEYRRRSSFIVIRANQEVSSTFQAANSNSAELTVSYNAAAAGTVTFEVSTKLIADSIQYYFTMPNFFAVEMKKEDLLHGSALEFGSKTKYLSDLDILSGDMQARVDWPDRDDPLSSELKIQSFKALDPETFLVGAHNYIGFAAEAEGVIDAGACLSLQARTTGTNIRGLSVELCDVDGSAQYLEVATFDIKDGKSTNRTRVGWVHIGFVQPTHLRIVRSPADLTSFEVSYRPDDRVEFAPLNRHHTTSGSLLGGFTGLMDVGVSVSTQEAYRYAEFYNVSIEECPATCGVPQVSCGMVTTACGTVLNCPLACPDSGVCYDGICMTCPPLENSTASWECGMLTQVCSNPAGQLNQVHRTLGWGAPEHHTCSADHKWICNAKSKFAYLSEGKECGNITDECGVTVELFPCPRTADRCQDYKCICHPHEFPSVYNCGSQFDGCGTRVYFGTQTEGACPSANDICIDHMCCTKKTVADFDSAWECGHEFDGCGGDVQFGTCAWPKMCNATTHLCYQPPYARPTFLESTGNCVRNATSNCLTSPNYPSSYQNRETCTATVGGDLHRGHIIVEEFHTEGGWDYLYVDGRKYSGRRRTGYSWMPCLHAGDKLAVADISWTSDGSITATPGWKICIAEGPADGSLLMATADTIEEDEDVEEDKKQIDEKEADVDN